MAHNGPYYIMQIDQFQYNIRCTLQIDDVSSIFFLFVIIDSLQK